MKNVIVLSNSTTMRMFKNKTVGILATLVLLFAMDTYVSAQTRGEVINETNNSMILRVESIEQLTKPTKILLVYDSNLITLESTSSMAKKYTTKADKSSMNSYNMNSLLASALIVDIEDDIVMEDWMLHPFKMESGVPSYLRQEEEEDMTLEPWMMDLNLWK